MCCLFLHSTALLIDDQIEFVKDKATKQPFEPSEGIAIGVQEKGQLSLSPYWTFYNSRIGMEEKYSIALYPGTGTADGTYGDHVLLSPAYNVTKEDIKLIAERASRVIEDFFAERRG